MAQKPQRERLPHPHSLAATSRAAHDLAGHLTAILEWFDALRIADQEKPPKSPPWWWDRYVEDHDWQVYSRGDPRPPNEYDRMAFLRYKVDLAVHRLTDPKEGIWAKLVDPLPLPDSVRWMFAACRESLRNLTGILSPATFGPRMRYGVIPDKRHLRAKLPRVWDPEQETDAEKRAKDESLSAAFELVTGDGKDKERAQRKLDASSERYTRVRDKRYERNRKGEERAKKLGLVRTERYNELVAARRYTEEDIKRWKLGEADVRALVDWLEGRTASAGSKDLDALNSDDLAVLACLNNRPTYRWKLTEISTEDGPQDRKAIGLIVGKLARLGYADFPPKSHKGVAILPKGIAALKESERAD